MDEERLHEIIQEHENGLNEGQDDPTSVFSNYIKHDFFTLDGITKHRLYFANTNGLEDDEEE